MLETAPLHSEMSKFMISKEMVGFRGLCPQDARFKQ